MSIEKTDNDVGYMVIKGRRWRCANPTIPVPLRQQLVNELMDARRAVKASLTSGLKADEKIARARVQCAKVALGERGGKWWLEQSKQEYIVRVDATIYSLLKHRSLTSTVCPSEVARVINFQEWRHQMDSVRERAWQLSDFTALSITQKGLTVEKGIEGPLRLSRGLRFECLPRFVKYPQ